ncbi:MAG: hypothetical protein K0B07_01255 [DPANN group archaeon]|nr:hypothetical protein [DPANN group archaeon]
MIIMIGAKEDYVMSVVKAILSVDGIGVKIGTENINYLTELYSHESLNSETIKDIYAEAKEDGPKYGTLTEALADVDLLEIDALYSTDFNYDSFVESMLSTYQVGTKKTIKELIELGDRAPGAFTFENNLENIYQNLDDTSAFSSLLEVYNNHGLLATPVLPAEMNTEVSVPVIPERTPDITMQPTISQEYEYDKLIGTFAFVAIKYNIWPVETAEVQ